MDFNIEQHKKLHHGYLEIIISPDGEIEYAIPSHQIYLLRKAMDITHLTEVELNNLCPEEYYGDFMRWLFFISRYLPVWENFVLDNVQVTRAQHAALKSLKVHGLYKGKLPGIKPLSRCPICGAEAKRSTVSFKGTSEYKYNCSNIALHVSCGDWYKTDKQARAGWEKRCMGFGQPENYRPTNEEHIRQMLRKAQGAEFYHAINSAHQMMSNISSDEAADKWLNKRYVPEKCANCLKQQMEYCVCKPFAPPEYLYIVSKIEPSETNSDSSSTRQVVTRSEKEAFKLLADDRNTLCRYSNRTGAEYWHAEEKEWKYELDQRTD